jgi:peptide/nickel transport system ATP-binding protein
LLSVEKLEVSYHVRGGALPALTDFDLNVRVGETVGVVGESGCGKTSLLWSIPGLLPPNGEITNGRIVFGGRDLTTLDPEALRRIRGREIAMIFQDPMTSLNPTVTIGRQLATVLREHADPGSRDRRSIRSRIVEMLTSVGIPDAEERLDLYPHEFSGGMRQRIVIAMALLLEPKLILADEPTSALDLTLEAQILELLKRLQQERQTAIVFVSHDLGVVSEICDRIAVVYAGRVVEEGKSSTMFDAPMHPYTGALLAATPSHQRRGTRLGTIPGRVPMLSELPIGCKFSPRCRHAHDACLQSEPPLRRRGNGHVRCVLDLDADAQRRSAAETDTTSNPSPGLELRRDQEWPLVTVRGLRSYFGVETSRVRAGLGKARQPIRAVDGVDLELRRGEILGLVGESGSGKTTLGRNILRLVRPTEGEITFEGRAVTSMTRKELQSFRRQAQMIFQDAHSSLSPRRRVSALLTEPYAIHNVPNEQRQSVRDLLEMVELPFEHASKYPHELSGGQARRIGIARALALGPSLIVADEPTAGLDVSAAASILNLMNDLRQRLNLTYLIITHNVQVVGHIADRIAVMYLGQLVESGPTEAIFDSAAHPYTRALLAAGADRDLHEKRRQKHRLLLPGEIPSPKNPPAGCRFHTRCEYAKERSRTLVPQLEEVRPGHLVACHYWREIDEDGLAVGSGG